ncbi:hypothetical protein A2U01_0117236, partial [Trifolium medium]|nr:hypothetical protein [Trifolium medium]
YGAKSTCGCDRVDGECHGSRGGEQNRG